MLPRIEPEAKDIPINETVHSRFFHRGYEGLFAGCKEEDREIAAGLVIRGLEVDSMMLEC